jgi:hypothetical protein
MVAGADWCATVAALSVSLLAARVGEGQGCHRGGRLYILVRGVRSILRELYQLVCSSSTCRHGVPHARPSTVNAPRPRLCLVSLLLAPFTPQMSCNAQQTPACAVGVEAARRAPETRHSPDPDPTDNRHIFAALAVRVHRYIAPSPRPRARGCTTASQSSQVSPFSFFGRDSETLRVRVFLAFSVLVILSSCELLINCHLPIEQRRHASSLDTGVQADEAEKETKGMTPGKGRRKKTSSNVSTRRRSWPVPCHSYLYVHTEQVRNQVHGCDTDSYLRMHYQLQNPDPNLICTACCPYGPNSPTNLQLSSATQRTPYSAQIVGPSLVMTLPTILLGRTSLLSRDCGSFNMIAMPLSPKESAVSGPSPVHGDGAAAGPCASWSRPPDHSIH